MKTKITLLLLLLCLAGCSQSLPEIDEMIATELNSGKVPALAVAIIEGGEVAHLSANGYRDWQNKTPITIHTAFHIASVSKTVTNMAIFKLVETKRIDLEADINDYLPFTIKNPHLPEDKITVTQLLNHRSGIRDNYDIYQPLWNEPKGDPNIGLQSFLQHYLHVDGDLFEKKHFSGKADYKSFVYSNTGVALLGLIVENVSGLNFEEFCQEKLFEPMEMTNTSWFLKNLDSQNVAKTYTMDKASKLIFKGHNGYPDYPAGQLRTSISDFSKLIAGYLNAGNGDFVLKDATKKQITPNPTIAHNGYFTWFITAMGNRLYYSHEGGDTGVRTVVMIDVQKKNGIIIFANAEYKLGNLLSGIEEKMWGN